MQTLPPSAISLDFRNEGCRRRLIAEQWVPEPLDNVFAFFSNPRNLEVLTPPEQKMRLVSPSPAPASMTPGLTLTYRLRVAGMPLSWTARIEECTENSFTDVMVKGPYRSWHHTHRFLEKDNGTLIQDEIIYKSYTCRYGHRWFIEPQLRKIFDARGKILEELFYGAASADTTSV